MLLAKSEYSVDCFTCGVCIGSQGGTQQTSSAQPFIAWLALPYVGRLHDRLLASHVDCVATAVDNSSVLFAGLAVGLDVSLLTELLCAEGGPGQGLKAEPAAAENAGTVDMSPLSLQGGAKGVGMQSPGSTGKTADRMAQALRCG